MECDLTTVLLAALEGFTVPAGTVALISSVSHLVAVVTAAYSEDLLRASKAVRAVYGTGITVMHGIPLLLSGLHCYSTIRSLLEIGTWYKSVTALSTKELSDSLSLLNSKLRDSKQHTSDTAPCTPENIRHLSDSDSRCLRTCFLMINKYASVRVSVISLVCASPLKREMNMSSSTRWWRS